jgi:hypothetical protein
VGRYQIALILKDVYDDVTENNGAVYGAKAIKAIQLIFGWDDGVIYRALHVAEAFTKEQIEGMTRMRLPGGKPLSYSHVVTLAGVGDERQRQKLLQEAIRHGWTSKRLAHAAELAEAPPARKGDRRGRPLTKPRDFDAVLDQQNYFIRDFLDRNEKVWSDPQHSLSAKVAELGTADFNPERADRLKRHAGALSVLARKAQERADEALAVHHRFLQILEERTAHPKRLALSAGGPAA